MSLSTSVLGTAPVHDPRERQKCTHEPFTRKRHCWYRLRASQSPSFCALRHVLMNSALIDDVTFCETRWITLMAAATFGKCGFFIADRAMAIANGMAIFTPPWPQWDLKRVALRRSNITCPQTATSHSRGSTKPEKDCVTTAKSNF